jgi:hypothetical protein
MVVRDQDAKVIDKLTAQFEIKFIGLEEVSECANIRAFVDQSIATNFVVAFDNDRDGEEIYVEEALKVAYGENMPWDTDVDCEILYQLQVWDKNMAPPQYVNLDIFLETLRNDWSKNRISSKISFDRHSSSITGFLRRSEFNDNIARFTDAGGFALKLRIVAMILESTVHGPANDKDTELPSIEFSFKLREA